MSDKPKRKKARRGRGEGGVYQRDDGQWTGSISMGTDPASGKRRRKVFYAPTKGELLEKMNEFRARTPQVQQASGQGRQKLSELLASWLDVKGREWSPGTAREHHRHADRHIVPTLGGVRIDKLDRTTIERFVGALIAEGVGKSTVGKVLKNTLKPALAWAVERDLLAFNPADGVRPPKHEASEAVALDPTQLRLFLGSARDNQLHALWLFSADSGCRQGEAFGLLWEHLNLATGDCSFKQSLEEINGHPRVKVLKTKASRRTVRLTGVTVAALQELRQRQAEAGNHRSDAPVFQDGEGGWLRKSNVFRRSFRVIVESANLAEEERAKQAGREPCRIPEDFTPHGLRHTCATLLLTNGVDILTVSRRLGHAKPSTTLNVYGHAMRNSQEKAAEALETLLV